MASTKGSDGGERADGGGKPLPPFASVHVWQIQAVRDVLFVGAMVAIFWAGYLLRAVTVPLLVAVLLAYLVEPIVHRLCRHRRMTRVRAVILLLVAGGGGVAIVLAIVLPLFVSQTVGIVNGVRSGEARERLAQLGRYVPGAYLESYAEIIDLLPGDALPPSDGGDGGENDGDGDGREAADGSGDAAGAAGEPRRPGAAMTEAEVRRLIDERLAADRPPPEGRDAASWWRLARSGTNTIARILGGILQAGLTAFLIPFYFFFFSLWYPSLLRFGRELIPERNREHTLHLLGRMDHVVAGFVRGRIVISLIMGVLLAIGWMVCGVPYAIVLGLVVGIFCAVPYLGIVGVPIAVGLLLVDQLASPADARMPIWAVLLWPTVVFSAVQLIEGYVLTPAIAGKVTNLDPVTILVAVLAGGSVLGVYGMLLAIPIAACGKILFTEVLMPKIRDWTEGRAADPLPIDRR